MMVFTPDAWEGVMKRPLWVQTLFWIAAIVAALLLALAGPDGTDFKVPHGAVMPR